MKRSVCRRSSFQFQGLSFQPLEPKLLLAADFGFAFGFGGPFNTDIGQSVATDSAGNVYTTGRFTGTVDFDPGPGTFNLTGAPSSFGPSTDIFVTKFDSAGNFVWAVNMGGSEFDTGLDIAVDGLGNVYTAGSFGGEADFDPGPGVFNLTAVGGNDDTFVSKLDSAGNFVWAVRMGGGGSDAILIRGIAVDNASNVFTTGSFAGTIDFDPGLDTYNLTSVEFGVFFSVDIFVSKLDSAGNFMWAAQMGGPGSESGTSVAVDPSGNVYTTGQFNGTTDFDPGPDMFELTSDFGDDDVFVSKLDSAGNFYWAFRMGGNSSDGASSIGLDSFGNVYTTGSFIGTADFDPGPGTFNLTSASSNSDIFVSKLDNEGNFLWARKIGNSSSNNASDIALDTFGNVYTTGSFQGTLDFDPGPDTFNVTSTGSIDIFVCKLESSGNFVWALRMGGISPSGGVARSIAVDPAGDVYTTGSFFGTVDFDPGAETFNVTSTFGSGDIFISQLRQIIPNQPPVADAGGPYSVDEGTSVLLGGASMSDPDGNPLTISWSVNPPGLCSFSDGTILNPRLTCDDNGTYTVILTVDDGTSDPVSSNANVTVTNVAPAATLTADGPVDEGMSFNLSLTEMFDPSETDTASGFTYAFDCGDGGGLSNFGFSNTTSCATEDNGVRNAKGQIKDKDGSATEYSIDITVNNVTPTVESITLPTAPLGVENQAGNIVEATFTDAAATNDEPYKCEFDMDFDGAAFNADVTIPGTSYNTCATALNYAEPGVYSVKLVVTDKDGDSGMGVASEFIVIYDPAGGFVTGGGWITSPAGALVADPAATGKANFGFVSKYKKGASIPTGNTEFNFSAGDLNFHSDTYDWLVVNQNDTNAQYKGSGTINGDAAPNGELFKFMIWAKDLDPTGDDTFRIKIWYEDTGSEIVVYDNGFDQAIGGGNIVVRSGNNLRVDPNVESLRRGVTISDAMLEATVTRAFADWSGMGVSDQQLSLLADVKFQIVDLAGPVLATTSIESKTISIDTDAAGFGWSPRLLDDEIIGVDLLSTVVHEFGHILGFDHDVLGDTLGVSQRRLPVIPVPGDSNRDGVIDRFDLIDVLQSGKYLTGESATWRDGDWNRDGQFDQLDVVAVLQAGNYAAITTVDEVFAGLAR